MNYAPLAPIIIRYIVGVVIGLDAANVLAGDPDLVSVLALVVSAVVETLYTLAVKRGWAK